MSRELGTIGETYVKQFLLKKGYQFVTQNYYTRYGEIDLIMISPENTLVFCEVKSYKSNSIVNPEFKIHYTKKRKIRRCAQQYLVTHDITQDSVQCDAVLVENGKIREHFINIPLWD